MSGNAAAPLLAAAALLAAAGCGSTGSSLQGDGHADGAPADTAQDTAADTLPADIPDDPDIPWEPGCGANACSVSSAGGCCAGWTATHECDPEYGGPECEFLYCLDTDDGACGPRENCLNSLGDCAGERCTPGQAVTIMCGGLRWVNTGPTRCPRAGSRCWGCRPA